MSIYKFKLTVPNIVEWRKLVEITKGDDTKIHWCNAHSWLDTEYTGKPGVPYCGPSRYYCTGDPGLGPFDGLMTADFEYPEYLMGYRPALHPDDQSVAQAVFSGMKDGDTIRFSTLALDGTPVKLAEDAKDAVKFQVGLHLSFENLVSDPNDCITWIKAGDVLIADRNLVTGISMRDLYSQWLLGAGRDPFFVVPDKEPCTKSIPKEPLWAKLGNHDDLDVLFKAAHFAGVLETEKRIEVPDWESLQQAVKEGIEHYMERSRTEDCDFFNVLEEHLQREFPMEKQQTLDVKLQEASSRMLDIPKAPHKDSGWRHRG